MCWQAQEVPDALQLLICTLVNAPIYRYITPAPPHSSMLLTVTRSAHPGRHSGLVGGAGYSVMGEQSQRTAPSRRPDLSGLQHLDVATMIRSQSIEQGSGALMLMLPHSCCTARVLMQHTAGGIGQKTAAADQKQASKPPDAGH